MRFKAGDKVRCSTGSPFNEVETGKVYTVDKASINDYGKEILHLKEVFHGAWSAARFSHVIKEDIRSGFDLNLGIVYGILYDRIKDTDEDLWIVAEAIAEALGEAEDNL